MNHNAFGGGTNSGGGGKVFLTYENISIWNDYRAPGIFMIGGKILQLG